MQSVVGPMALSTLANTLGHLRDCAYAGAGAYDGIRTRGGASKPVHSRRSTAGGFLRHG